MKKLALAAIAASSLSVAAPAFADNTAPAADPFVSTQMLSLPAYLPVIFGAVVIAAAVNTN